MWVNAEFGCTHDNTGTAPPLSKSDAGRRRNTPTTRTTTSVARTIWRFRDTSGDGIGEESSNLCERQAALAAPDTGVSLARAVEVSSLPYSSSDFLEETMFQETPVATDAPVRPVNAASPPRLSFVYAL